MDEIWREVSNNPNYRVSNSGRIMRVDTQHEKVPRRDTNGYYTTDLYHNGRAQKVRVHRVVAQEFIPNPDNKSDINHKDGNKNNNSVDNLEWVTKSENMLHAYRTGLVKPHATYGMRGHKNPNGGRKGIGVRIVETDEEFSSIKECADSFNGSDRAICECLRGRQHTHRGYHFEYI